MKKDLTEIVFILDESGSMSTCKDDTIGGFNEFIESQKKIKGEVKFTFVKFSDYYKVIHSGESLGAVSPLNEDTYTPTYSTALLDAVGRSITSVGARLAETPEDERPEKVLVVIMTDGYENASTDFSGAKINEMVKLQRDTYNWEFIFLGADIDAWSGGSSMGMYNNVSISKTEMKSSFSKLSNYAAGYRMNDMAAMSMDTFTQSDEETEKQMKDLQQKSK
jgi:hypothetical protein